MGALKDHTAYMMAVLLLTMLVVLITQHYCVIDTSFAMLPNITFTGAASSLYYLLVRVIKIIWDCTCISKFSLFRILAIVPGLAPKLFVYTVYTAAFFKHWKNWRYRKKGHLRCYTSGNGSPSRFCIDSGSNVHIVTDKHALENFKPAISYISSVKAKHNLTSGGTGTLRLRVMDSSTQQPISLIIKNVHYCAQAAGGILSVSKLIEAGVDVNFKSLIADTGQRSFIN